MHNAELHYPRGVHNNSLCIY